MNSLQPPSLGPIVGHTTDRTCRLWIRAKDYKSRTTVGVVAVLEENDKEVIYECPLYYFPLGLEDGCIGTFNLGSDVDLGNEPLKNPQDHLYRLKPNTKYKVCLGTLTTNMTENKIRSKQALRKKLPKLKADDFKDLIKSSEKKSVAVFWTFPDPHLTPAQSLTFLLGSCHHSWSDCIFVPMDQQVCDDRGADRPRFVLMVGDQIYADKWSKYIPIERAETYEDFQERYRTAFGSHNMRRLLRHVPTYMILDDHEIEDNWSPERGKETDLFANAIKAYKNYQWSHGPWTFNDDEKFYYKFDVAGYPFFVLDTRTKRAKKKKDITKNDMLGKKQLKCLLAWLKNMQEERGNVPKFIVSPNVFVPNERAERTGQHNPEDWLSKSDSWPAFPTTREAILDCIVKNEVPNVVFLSGDIHCSNIAKISFTDSNRKPLVDRNDKPLKAFSITSSPFYSPIADGDDEAYVGNSENGEEADSFPFGNGFTMNYRSFFPFVANANNFCRVEIKQNEAKIVISFFDDDGDKIKWSDPQSTSNYPDSQSFHMETW